MAYIMGWAAYEEVEKVAAGGKTVSRPDRRTA